MAADEKLLSTEQYREIIERIEQDGGTLEWEPELLISYFAFCVPPGFVFSIKHVVEMCNEIDVSVNLTVAILQRMTDRHVITD